MWWMKKTKGRKKVTTILWTFNSLPPQPMLMKFPSPIKFNCFVLWEAGRMRNEYLPIFFFLLLFLLQHELQRGDVPKSVQCYMHESGASEEKARDHIRFLIKETWTIMNEELQVVTKSPKFSESFIEIAITNLARVTVCLYHEGDGFSVQDLTKDLVLSLFVHPMPL